MKILIEAVGSYTSGYLIDAIQSAGHHCVASDISADSAGAILADSFICFPTANAPDLWVEIERLLIENNIDVVIPTFDEMLLGWAERKTTFAKLGIYVVVSESSTISLFNDKWDTYLAFSRHNVPSPEASLEPLFQVFKPRIGRGGQGVYIHKNKNLIEGTLPDGYLSQQLAEGGELTVDCLFDNKGQLIYGVPRKRLLIKEGKSTSGLVVGNDDVLRHIKRLAESYLFQGPINFQCFVDESTISFIEVNARFGGGSGLGMAATENWIPLIIENFVNQKAINANFEIKHGMKMYRQYRDVFNVD